MEAADSRTIAPARKADNRRRAPIRKPSRSELARSPREVLVDGAASKADVYVVDLGQGPMVVKDFDAKPWWGRWMGRILVWRELRAYQALSGVRGIAPLVGRIDAHALAVEKIAGERMFTSSKRFACGEAWLAVLRAVLDEVHARGIAHLDMRGRENVLVDGEGQVYLIDFQSAVRLRPGGLGHRALFHWFKAADDSALLKWREQIAPQSMTAEDRRLLERHERIRGLWPFNRKRSRSREGRA